MCIKYNKYELFVQTDSVHSNFKFCSHYFARLMSNSLHCSLASFTILRRVHLRYIDWFTCILLLSTQLERKRTMRSTVLNGRSTCNTRLCSSVVDEPRRVTFLDEARVLPTISPSSFVDTIEPKNLWYSTRNMQDFKISVREIGQQQRRLAREDPLYIPQEQLQVCTRGTEYYVSAHRKKLKHLTIRTIVKAQHRCSSPDHLALVAQKYTARAKEEAYAMGMSDYVDVYYPNLCFKFKEKQVVATLASSSLEKQHNTNNSAATIA